MSCRVRWPQVTVLTSAQCLSYDNRGLDVRAACAHACADCAVVSGIPVAAPTLLGLPGLYG